VHHLTCVECGNSSTLANCPVEQHSLAIHTPEDFTPLFHTLEVFGICANCKATK
jgi:Fur family ferric uptake transcriptional regulator